MVTPERLCPFGLKSGDRLKRKGYSVDDRWLRTCEQADEFKRREGVDTTAQTFIDGQRIGGSDDVRRFFGKRVADPDATQYRPVLVVFAVALLMALASRFCSLRHAVQWASHRVVLAMSMTLMGMLKLRDVEGFSDMFLGYDLLAQRVQQAAQLTRYTEGFRKGVLQGTGRTTRRLRATPINGVAIGTVATLLGVGGSVMTVPLMRRAGLSMAQSLALANPLSMPVALIGSLMYAVTGQLATAGINNGFLGYIYLPAFVLSTVGSLIGIRLTLALARRIPDRLHAHIYIALLILVLLALVIN